MILTIDKKLFWRVFFVAWIVRILVIFVIWTNAYWLADTACALRDYSWGTYSFRAVHRQCTSGVCRGLWRWDCWTPRTLARDQVVYDACVKIERAVENETRRSLTTTK